VAAASRAQGWEAGPGQLGKVMGEIRRALRRVPSRWTASSTAMVTWVVSLLLAKSFQQETSDQTVLGMRKMITVLNQ
jgi:hypothetical protein